MSYLSAFVAVTPAKHRSMHEIIIMIEYYRILGDIIVIYFILAFTTEKSQAADSIPRRMIYSLFEGRYSFR